MELKVTMGRVMVVWWAYFWRSVIAMGLAIVIAGAVAFIVGFMLGGMGVPSNIIYVAGQAIGLIVGMVMTVLPIKMILGKDYGKFRLVLLAKEPVNPQQA